MSVKPTSSLGRYELIREIARSNDIVFEGWDPQTQRRVAIKALNIPDGASDTHRADRMVRFNREARATARLHHTNIVTLFDFGEDLGQPYLVFEFIDGPTLTDVLLQKGPLSPEAATASMLQLLSALDYAHSRGVIHRDIKPSNIFICGNDKLMIADLGIARIESEQSVTTDGQVFGTPAYMAPEQVRGKDFDRRVDLWAAGAVLFQMVTGVQPFGGGSVLEIGSNVLNAEPEFALIRDDVVRSVVQKAMTKDPEQRFANAGAMMRALCNPVPTPAVPVSTPAVVVAHVSVPIGQPTVAIHPVRVKRSRTSGVLAWVFTCLTAAAMGAGLVIWKLQPTAVAPANRSVPPTTIQPVAAKSLEDLVSEAWEHTSLHDLVDSEEFKRLPQGAQQDLLDSWAREAMGRDYLALTDAWQHLFLNDLMERLGNVAMSFPSPRNSAFPLSGPGLARNALSLPPPMYSSGSDDLSDSFFDVGSSETAVERIQGRPDSVLYKPGEEELHYGGSVVLIRNGHVADYSNAGNLRALPRSATVAPSPSSVAPPTPRETSPSTPPPSVSPPAVRTAPSSSQPTPAPATPSANEDDTNNPRVIRSDDLDDSDVLQRLHFQYDHVRVLPGGVREYSGPSGVVRIK